MADIEDIPYNVDPFATPDKPQEQTDDDQPNKSVLLEVQKYLEHAIVEHNTFDVIDLTGVIKLTVEEQVAVSKAVVAHLRTVKSVVDDKIKELK